MAIIFLEEYLTGRIGIEIYLLKGKIKMMQIPNLPNYMTVPQQPNYNAVKIDVLNPMVNVPAAQTQVPAQCPVPQYEAPTMPIYNYPTAPVQPYYMPPVINTQVQNPEVAKTPVETAAPVDTSAKEIPVQPEVVPPAPVVTEAPKKEENKEVKEETKDSAPVEKKVEIVEPEESRQEINNNKNLSNEQKMAALEATSTEKEKAERNKSYAIFTAAIMQKLYGKEYEKMNNATVPLTELPGAVTIVEQLKNNPNAIVRTSAIEALSYIQAPNYKKDLTTIFTIAQNDQDKGVQEAAKAALEKLNEVPDEQAPEAAEVPEQKNEEVKQAA